MTDNGPKLTCITFNCEHANDTRLPHLLHLFTQCYFLFLQEHGLYKSQFGWFDKIDNGVSKHEDSAMNENSLLRGRPNGGAVILWRKNINHKVVPGEYGSDRMCAVTVQY